MAAALRFLVVPVVVVALSRAATSSKAVSGADSRGDSNAWQDKCNDDGHSVDVQQVLRWAEEKADIQCPYLAADATLPVRGVATRWHMPARTVMISMPSKMALSVAAGQPSPMPDLVPEQTWRALDGSVQIALVLLREKKRGSLSPWHVWIQSLPKTFSALMHWSTAELQRLQTNTTAIEQEVLITVKKQTSTVQASYNKLQRTTVVRQLNISLAELIWAVNVATSRPVAIPKHWTQIVQEALAPIIVGSFGLLGALLFTSSSLSQWQSSQEVAACCQFVAGMSVVAVLMRGLFQQEGVTTAALLPVVDSINHNSSASSKVQRTWVGDRLEAVIMNEVPAGQEITFSYAPKPNEDFLQYYGFVDTDNKHDAYKADLLSYVTQNFEVEPKRLEAVQRDATWLQTLQQAQLTRQGWAASTTEALFQLLGHQKESSFTGINPVQLLQNLLQHLSPLSFKGNVESHNVPQTAPHSPQTQTKKRVLQALYQFCQHILSSKPTTLEADIARLQSMRDEESQDERHILALQFRIGKKQLLRSCLWQYDPQQLADA